MLTRTHQNDYYKYGITALFCLMLGACATQPTSPVTISGKVLPENIAAKQSLNSTEQTALNTITVFKDFLAEHKIKEGAIAISFNGEIVGSHGVNRLVTDAVPVASLSKAITAVCTMDALKATGKTLNTTLDELFPEFFLTKQLPDDRFKNINVQQLLVHTSGIQGSDVIEHAYRKNMMRKESSQWIFKQIATQQLASEPGRKYDYDNANYAILGLIITRLTNQPYSQYCNENIMKTSGANSAQMYQQWLIKSSFGGWKVSAIDYLTFIDTYFRNPRGIGRLRFTKPKDYNYGLGALYRKTNTGYHYWHSGSFRWQSRAHNVSYGAFFAVLANGFSVVANFNRDGGDGRQGSLDDALYNALYGF